MMFTLFGGAICPFTLGKMYPSMYGGGYDTICFGVQIFLLVWVVAVPIVITSRLDRIVKLLQDKK